MTMVTLNSPNSNPSQTLSTDNTTNNHLRDPSFSSYLNSTDEPFVLKLAGSTQTLRDDHVIWAKKMAKDREISVFGAEKYFNEEMLVDRTKKMVEKNPEIKKGDDVYLDPIKRIVPSLGTSSVHSESSWNSQSMLLKRNSAKSKTNKVHGKSFFSSIGCKCVCSDKNSVDIDENKLDKSISCRSSIHTNHRMAKTPITASFDMAEITKPLSQSWVKNETITHKSHDNFGSNGRGLTVTKSWDAKMRSEEINQIPSSIVINNNSGDETESDASSDLFEIESLTGKANPNLSRQLSEGMMSGCVTPTNGYAPSEASIEWSVVTASVADFSLSCNADEVRSAHLTKNRRRNSIGSAGGNGNKGSSKELTRRHSGNFMSCKSHKAVRVAGDEYRTSVPHKPTHGVRSHSPPGSHMPYI